MSEPTTCEFFTIREAAAKLRLGYWTLCRRINSGEIEYIDYGPRSKRLTSEHLTAYVEKMTKGVIETGRQTVV